MNIIFAKNQLRNVYGEGVPTWTWNRFFTREADLIYDVPTIFVGLAASIARL
jgi:hypothetical protein